jgi:hypothetical protein
MMTVVERDEKWVVVGGPFEIWYPTSAEAWRFIDRVEGQPISRSEKVAEFVWERSLDRTTSAQHQPNATDTNVNETPPNRGLDDEQTGR